MPRIWVTNPEKWQKLGKINPKNPEFNRNFWLDTLNREKFNLTQSAKIDYCEAQFFKRTYSPKFRVKYV